MSDKNNSNDTPAPAAAGTSAPAEGTAAPVTKVEVVPAPVGLLALVALVICLGATSYNVYLSYFSNRAAHTATADLGGVLVQMKALQDQLSELPTNAAPTDLTPLQSRLDALEARLAASRAAPAPDPRTAEKIEALQARQEQLIERLSEIDQLKKTISQLEKELGGGAQQNTAEKTLLAASLQLTSAWQNSKPFDAPWLAVLAAASASDPDLAAQLNDMAPSILPWRDRGVPTLGKLSADFAPAARAAIAASLPEGASWWQRTQQQVEGLVTIRRQGALVPGDDMALDAVLARAEAALAQNQLAAAVEEVEKIEEAPQPLQDWLAASRAHLAAQALATLLSEKAAGYLSARADVGRSSGPPAEGDVQP
jgi:hypothetical protein